jgi:hypothetical protein
MFMFYVLCLVFVFILLLHCPIYEVFIILKDVTMTWQKWGSKQALEKRKASLSLMEVFSIALKCSLQILRTFGKLSLYIEANHYQHI